MKNIQHTLKLLFATSLVLVGVSMGIKQTIVFAQSTPVAVPGSPTTPGTSQPTVPGAADVRLDNPFKTGSGVGNLCDLINKILAVIAEIGAIVGVLCIIWSGFLFIKAQGNKDEIQKAKNTFYTTVIGLAILLGASVIAKIIFTTVSSITTSFNSGASICAPASSSTGPTTTTPTGTGGGTIIH